MNNRIKKIMLIVIFLIGVIIFIYPIVSEMIKSYLMQHTIVEYKKEILNNNEDNKKEEIDSLYNKMKEYNEKIYIDGQKTLVDPFSYEAISFNLLDFGFKDNIFGYITIPKMNIEVPIYLGATKENMNKGAVHLSETSIPIGGVNTNSVIAAHRGMPSHPMFRDIELLEIGDKIIINNPWETLTYEVKETKVINPGEISEVLIQDGKELVTLITCHPYTKNYHRYVVYCERKNKEDTIENNGALEIKNQDTKKEYNLIKIEKLLRYVGFAIIIILLLVVIMENKIKRK